MSFHRLQWEPRHFTEVGTPSHSCNDFYHGCQQGLELDDPFLDGPFQPKAFYDDDTVLDREWQQTVVLRLRVLSLMLSRKLMLCALTGCRRQITTQMMAIMNA